MPQTTDPTADRILACGPSESGCWREPAAARTVWDTSLADSRHRRKGQAICSACYEHKCSEEPILVCRSNPRGSLPGADSRSKFGTKQQTSASCCWTWRNWPSMEHVAGTKTARHMCILPPKWSLQGQNELSLGRERLKLPWTLKVDGSACFPIFERAEQLWHRWNSDRLGRMLIPLCIGPWHAGFFLSLLGTRCQLLRRLHICDRVRTDRWTDYRWSQWEAKICSLLLWLMLLEHLSPLMLIKNCCSTGSSGWPAGSGNPMMSLNSSISRVISPHGNQKVQVRGFHRSAIAWIRLPLMVRLPTADAISNPQSSKWSGNIREKVANQE